MEEIPEDIILKKSLYKDHLIEVLEGDGDYWFQCRSIRGGEEETDRSSHTSPRKAEIAGKAFIDSRIEANDSTLKLEIKWPWTMLPLSVADEYIEYLNQRIAPEHPLYGKKVFPACRREDSQEPIVQFDLDDDNSYAIVSFGEKQLFNHKELPKVEMLASLAELKERFEKDHRDAMESNDDDL